MEVRTTNTKASSWLSGLFLALALIMTGHQCMAQTFSASIAGTVTDPSGAAIQGADLQLLNVTTRDIRHDKSGQNGNYAFTNLLPGTYEITAAASGFERLVQTGMILRANTAATVNISLKVGTTQQQVVVSGEAVLLDTESANNSITMDSALIENLPNNTLNPLNFVYDLAGTTEAQGGMTSRSNTYDQYGSTFGLNGGRSAESEILIDGAPSTAIDWGGLMVSPMQDSVQEQQVVQNEYDAQYERGGEGVVTLVTRGGSSNFHGEAYDFMRNSGLDANTWSNDFADSPKSKLHRNQFGGNIGGPIWRRHNLFFFGAYEGLRQPQTEPSGLLSVPTAAERSGDFSNSYSANGTLDVIYNPFSTHLVTDAAGNSYYTRDPFPGNKIPASMIDPVGAKIAALWGQPNRPSTGPYDLNDYYQQGAGMTSNDKFDWRVDWAQSPKHRIFARMSDRVRENDTPPCYFCNGADEAANNDDHGFQVVVNDTVTPSPTWVIDSYAAYTRWWEGQTSIGYGVANASAIGLSPGLFQAPLLPLVNAQNYYTLGSTYSSYDRYVRYLSTGLVNLTKQLRAHTVKFGVNYDVNMINNRQDSPGNFNFDNGLTSCDPNTDPGGGPCMAQLQTNTTGNAIASLLLGAGSGGSANINMDPAMSLHTVGTYIQDSWRATPRLTVSAGLRYENQRPATERHNRLAYFDTSAINPLSTAFGSTLHGAFEYAGVDGRGRYAWQPDNLNFGPRLGLAYRFTDKLVGRAGSGIFYGPASAMVSFDSPGEFPGYTSQTNWISTTNGGYTPNNLVSSPFPQGITQPTGNSQGPMTLVGYGAGQLWPKGPHPVGEMYQWSMDVQYQVSSHSVAELGYTGVRGRRLLFGNPNFDLTQMSDKYLSLGNQLNSVVNNPFYGIITDPNSYLSQQQVAYNQLLRPFPEFTYLQQTRSLPGARSQFDALTAKYNHSFSNGLSWITTYQWSKNMDDGSEALLGWAIGDMWRDATNPKLDYAISTHDVPQSFATAWTYQLPYGHGRQWGGDSPQIVNQVIGGWDVSGAIRLESGLPFPNPVEFSYNPLGNFGFPGPGMPSIVADPRPAHRTTSNWVNINAFAGASGISGNQVACGNANDPCQPFPFSNGNEPQRLTQVREAATKNLDLGIAKEFGPERVRTQLRGDFLNVFNHPVYGGSYNIGDCIDCGDLGQVYGTRNDPRNIQVSLKVSF
jgi:Carboxypeptidase regulatory-like domain